MSIIIRGYMANIRSDRELKEMVSAREGDFKKIINNKIKAGTANLSPSTAMNILNTKLSMDFFEEMNTEVSRDSVQ